MSFVGKIRLRWAAALLFCLSALFCTGAAGQADKEASLQDVDSNLTRYRGMNTSQVNLTTLCKFSLQQPFSPKSATPSRANWIYRAPTLAPSSAERKIDLQDLMEHLPLAGQTIQMVTTTADAHPQVSRIVRFLTKHVDPQF